MYPDRHGDQAHAGVRHKALLSLKGFSGLHVLNKMDKHFNVIVIITTDDVIPMSFEAIDQRTEWLTILQGHFGKGNFTNLNIKSFICITTDLVQTKPKILFDIILFLDLIH